MLGFCSLGILFSLTCHLSQGANNFRNELPIGKIYEIRPTTSTKLEVGEVEHVVDKPPNSNIVVGEDIQSNSKLVLECDARYPVGWVYIGDGEPEYSTNTTQTQNSGGITRPDNLFSASISIGFRRKISYQDSGKYICRGLQNPDLSVFYFLYVSDENRIFVNHDGDTIYYKPSDPFVRIPCGVSNPRATVSLQKSINGLVQCPLNESITYDSSKGFELKVSNYFDPQGTYVCTAGFNNTYQVVSYKVIRDVDQTGIPPVKGTCQKNSDCQSSQACIRSTNGYECTSPCGSVCGRNTQCDVSNHIPRCHCLPGHSGDPYNACFANIQPETIAIKDSCNPNPCGVNTICERHGVVARCKCSPGTTGDPYVRCHHYQQLRDPCSPNPCGANSVCNHRNGFTSCSCKTGYYGQPPYCRAECEINSDCPSDRSCVLGRCRNPCEGACSKFHRTECRVINRNPVCAHVTCPTGYYGRECLSLYVKEDGQIKLPERLGEQRSPSNTEQQTPCSPFPCGIKAECIVKSVENSVLNVTTDVALCQCPPNLTGNADIECYAIEEQSRNFETVESTVKGQKTSSNLNISFRCTPECGINANCSDLNTCICPDNHQGNPFIKCYPISCTTAVDCDNVNSSCVNGKCVDKTVKQCGVNAISINSDSKSTCICPMDHTGIPTIACHPLKTQTNDTTTTTITTITPLSPNEDLDNCECGRNAKCVQVEGGKSTICECIDKFEGDPNVGCELNCTSSMDCPEDHLCHDVSHRCVNPCEPEYMPFFVACGRNAACKVENHLPLCYCPENYPHGSPNTHCKEEGWMPDHHITNGTCQDGHRLNCGPNSLCKRFHDLERCVCEPGHFGDPTGDGGCKVGIQCRRHTQCGDEEECLNGKCLKVCRNRNSCGPFAGCRAENHSIHCICHIGTIQLSNGECEAAKGALAERKCEALNAISQPLSRYYVMNYIPKVKVNDRDNRAITAINQENNFFIYS